MSDSPTDFYHQKTDAELQFFVEHPDYYQPALVEQARRELRRRGVAVSPPVPTIMTNPVAAPSGIGGLPTGPLLLGVVGIVALCLAVLYFIKQKDRPAVAPVVVAASRAPKGPPRLIEVATSVIPNYDIAALVDQQLRRVPAAERARAANAEMPLRQYRELCKRFWTAETQTEYLTNQAHAGKAGDVFAEQTLLVRETWRDWNKAIVYRYKFGPAMQAQFENMQSIASSQQHILEMLPGLLPKDRFRTDKELLSREADVEGWLAGLLPKSPVTGRAYKAPELTIRM